MIHNILRSFELTEKEIEVFIQVLDLGMQPASHIARMLEMPRNTVRSILDKLVKTGIVIKTSRANTQYYSVENKKNIIRMLRQRKVKFQEEIDTQIELLEKYAGDFDSRFQAKSRPKITFYEGTAGLEKTYEDTLTSSETIRSWASVDDMHDALPEYFPKYYARRAGSGIAIRSIHPDTLVSRERVDNDGTEARASALVPRKKFYWTPEIQMYDGKINIASWKEKLGIIIESPEICAALSVIFEMSWETAKRYDQDLKK